MASTTGLPKVSLNLGPNYLVENNQTFSAHVFNVTGGIIPEDGLIVSVKATNLSEFDLDNIEVVDGEIVNVREDGFDLRLTDLTTLINLPVAADGEAEGLETATFTLESGDGYEVNSDLSGGSFNITDTVEEIPFNVSEPNDTIPLAVDSRISSENPQVTLSGSLDFDIGNRYQNPDGSFTYVDGTEDVDFYKVDLKADDIVAFDIDAVVKGNPAIPDLERDRTQGNVIFRLFDESGNELAARDLGSGAGELFATSTDPYLEFQAPVDGSYYLGLSVFTNGTPYRFGGDLFGNPEQYKERAYNPFVPESGDGDSRGGLDYRGIGEYDLQITLNPENPLLVAPQLDRSNNTPPQTVDIAAPGEPTVSLDFISATYDGEDNLISNNLVEGLPIQGSILTLLLETEGEIPEEGILVTINSDTYLRDYFTVRSLISAPFSPGAELIDVVTDDTGRETGVQLRVFQPKTFFPLNARTQLRGELVEPETDGPEEATFFLEAGEGYGVSEAKNQITATFYDNPEQAPIPEVIPEVSISITNNELYESEASETTLKFTLSEPPPEEGVLVYLKADKPALAEFDVLNAEISGGAFPFPNGEFSGFYFKITEQEASINFSVFPNPISEGLQSYNFALQETSLYTINQDAAAINFIVGDNPDSVVEVSLSGEPEILIESENTTSIHTFDLTAPPPEDGVSVEVNAPNLNEFDLEAVEVTGGEITEVTDTGFLLNINETTATVELPVLSDGEAEGVETANFTLIENSDNYFVNAEANQTTFTIVDIPEQTPAPAEETGPNDTISQAVDLNLNPQNTSARVKGNLFPREDGVERADYRDFSEDVDFYSLDLKSGDTVKIDIDSIPFETARFPGVEQRLDSELRLFDADGNEIVRVNNAAAPDEQLHRDPYLEFTAEETGNYYVGISQLGNRNYDPNVERSGSGWIFPEIGVFSGEYELNVELTPGKSEPIESTFENIFGTIKVDVIEVEGSNQIVFGGSSDDLIDASISSTGNNRIYSGSGDDTVILGISDRIVGGVGEDKFFAIGGGDNIITGGEGADQFWIATAEIPDAANVITDFTSGEDVLGIGGLGIGFDDLSITQLQDNTLIAANNSELAILQGISADSLIIDNFAFG